MTEAKHEIDGVMYTEARRVAFKGERVVIVNNESFGFIEGYVGEVTEDSKDHVIIDDTCVHYHHEYLVLEPVLEPEATSQSSQEERIAAVCDEVKALLIRKNRDYGDSFAKQYAKYGVLSGLIRMDDKISRIDNLVSGAEDSVGESLADSMLDLSGYSILTLVEMRKAKEAAE